MSDSAGSAYPGSAWHGRLWLAPRRGVVLYVGTGGSAAAHAHHAVQLAVSFDAPLRVTVGSRSLSTRSAIVRRDQPHAFHAEGLVAMAWIDPHGPAGRALADPARGLDEPDLVRAVTASGPPTTAGDVARLLARLLDAAGAHMPVTPPASPPVLKALDYVEAAVGGKPSLTEAAAHAAISPSRLTHLFTREVGIPFRRFVLWSRLVRAVEAVGAGSDLTTAAAAAGFTDSAHLSRTFRANFGLPPSALLLMDLVAEPGD